MTTIVAIQGNGWAVIGGDSRAVGDRTYKMADIGKVVENGPYIIATCGDIRAVNLLAHAFKPPAPPTHDLDAFITTKFIPALRKCFELHGYEHVEKAVATHDSEILVAVNGVIYEIGEDYAWVRDKTGLYGLGSGGHIALGALTALQPESRWTIPAARRIATRAIEISAALDPYTALPHTIIVQKSTKEGET